MRGRVFSDNAGRNSSAKIDVCVRLRERAGSVLDVYCTEVFLSLKPGLLYMRENCAADDRGSFALPAEVAQVQGLQGPFWFPHGDHKASHTCSV